MEVLDARTMREADRITIEDYGVPSLVLMENAGLRTAESIVEELTRHLGGPTLVLCGPGNNGGDGFVVARHLRRMGLDARALLVGKRPEELSGDPALMCRAFTGTGGELSLLRDSGELAAALDSRRGSLLVDALFGTGLSRPLEGLPAELVRAMNASGAALAAVDIPSGLFASEARVPGVAVEADLTVTFARPKVAHLLPPAEEHCGRVVVVDIGIPDRAVEQAGSALTWLDADDAAALVPERDPEDHKGRFGHVLVVGGSEGKAGAVALSAMGALRSGAGLVTLAAPGRVRAEAAAFAPELMSERLAAAEGETLAREGADRVLALATERDVLALGPGLGTGEATSEAVRAIVAEAELPVVLDADGLNAFAGAPLARLAQRRGALVMTPHPGEAARLLGASPAGIQEDRLGAARRLAEECDAIVLLKGYRTLIAAPGGHVVINPSGNPGLASGGSGDVLTGLVAGLIGQRLDPLHAAALGAFVHGLAADLALRVFESEATLTASVLLDHLPEAFRTLMEGDEEDDAA